MRKICYMCKHWNGNSCVCDISGTTTSSSYTCSSFDALPCCGNCKYYTGTRCTHHGMSIDDDELICKDDSWSKKTSSSSASSDGCYIATCVYGSYDCPQVWTLRRYRDNTLAKTVFGRTFIKIYYAISPTLVKWFGKTTWFKRMWKSKLDSMVYKLNLSGVDNTPYSDKK